MNQKLLILAFSLIGGSLVFFGCATQTKRIDASDGRGISTVRDINTKDWQEISNRCVNSLLASGALNRADNRKSIVMVSEIKDQTRSGAKTAFLTSKVRQALLASGKAVTTSAVGVQSGRDNAVRQVREWENDDLFNQKTVKKRGTVLAPDLSLSGEIVHDETKSGRTVEGNFMFHVVVTDLSTGLAVWEDTFEITKQEIRSLF